MLSRKPVAPQARGDLPLIHPGEAWWPFRARSLKLTDRQVRERDAAVSDKVPPDQFWDQETALESVNLWTALCNECHGGRRKAEDALAMPQPPPGWGRSEGLFFGKRRLHAELFAIVHNGGPPRNGKLSEMPPWRGKIAREQMWALLYFLEYMSGGIEGPFAPSLQPRRTGEVRKVFE